MDEFPAGDMGVEVVNGYSSLSYPSAQLYFCPLGLNGVGFSLSS